MHCERYPNHKLERAELVKELRELVIHASAGTDPRNPLTLDYLNKTFRNSHFGYVLVAL